LITLYSDGTTNRGYYEDTSGIKIKWFQRRLGI
jgi:hypothetical protein